jgi:hypothetical protein
MPWDERRREERRRKCPRAIAESVSAVLSVKWELTITISYTLQVKYLKPFASERKEPDGIVLAVLREKVGLTLASSKRYSTTKVHKMSSRTIQKVHELVRELHPTFR